MSKSSPAITCTVCGRVTPFKYAEKHHLTPFCKKGKVTVPVCIDCGNQIHQLFTVQELAQKYHTVEALKNEPRMLKWVLWIRKRNEFGVCMKTKKRK